MTTSDTPRLGSRFLARLPVLVAVVLVGAVVGAAVFVGGSSSRPITAPQAPDPRPEMVQSARDELSEAKLLFGLLTAAVSSGSATVTTLTAGASQIFDAVDTARQGTQQLATALDRAPSLSAAGSQVSTLTAGAANALGQVSGLVDAAEPLGSLVDRVVGAVESNAIPGARAGLPALRSLQSATDSISSQTRSVGALRRALDGIGPAARSSTGSVDAAIGSARRSAEQLRDGFTTLASARSQVTRAADTISKTFGQLTNVLDSISGNISAAQADLGPTAPITPPASVGPTTVVLARDNAPLIARSALWAAVAGLVTLILLGGVPVLVRHRPRRRETMGDDPNQDTAIDGGQQ